MIARLMALLALRERAKVAIHNAQEAAVEAAVRIAIKIVAAIFLLIGFIYGTIALYLWLATLLDAWAAMAIVAGIVLALGLVVLMLGGGSGKEAHGHGAAGERPVRPHPAPTAAGRTRGAPPSAMASDDPMAALAAKAQMAGITVSEQLRRNPEMAVAAAVATGFLIGRSAGARKLLLAGLSAALGAQASNRREH
ncbi:phage holin family protein [Caenispirillum bisanense]|uniref:Holin-X, holin superfamily III n=1 Tax=Caenispirillum bisanense TaxID=414052 RepID=A0A286G667_9PROT|nr:phage holin family protein [Caenispirillum bisanense]SOD91050.1 hypothetical protein SAMN05421508_101784 [Caenispirillum bisanense]